MVRDSSFFCPLLVVLCPLLVPLRIAKVKRNLVCSLNSTYCHNPIVLEEKLRGEPDYVVPFQIDKKKAQEIFTQWVGRKKFVPDYFFSASQIESMTGVYFPYWLYSCQVKGDLQAEERRSECGIWRECAIQRQKFMISADREI